MQRTPIHTRAKYKKNKIPNHDVVNNQIYFLILSTVRTNPGTFCVALQPWFGASVCFCVLCCFLRGESLRARTLLSFPSLCWAVLGLALRSPIVKNHCSLRSYTMFIVNWFFDFLQEWGKFVFVS